ncbi:MAG TPA: cyclic nucleotide-binding domain-containing protein, partial [Armatimonadota bacterium]|nr:cyclic nucleotide-binding domain-containing protein [Armatimonadota bacterium]
GLDTLVALSDLCRERDYQNGADIVRQGDPADNFYVVTGGEVEVVRANGTEKTVGRFGSGYHFGEIALLGSELRTATVRAVAPTRVLELPGQAFVRHLMGIPLARYRIGRIAAQRRAQILCRNGKKNAE